MAAELKTIIEAVAQEIFPGSGFSYWKGEGHIYDSFTIHVAPQVSLFGQERPLASDQSASSHRTWRLEWKINLEHYGTFQRKNKHGKPVEITLFQLIKLDGGELGFSDNNNDYLTVAKELFRNLLSDNKKRLIALAKILQTLAR